MAEKAALPPGTLVHVGKASDTRTKISVLDYDENTLRQVDGPDELEMLSLSSRPTVTWFKVDGVHDIEIIGKLGQIFDLHPLVTEDIVNTTQRPKLEDYENYLFLVLKALVYDQQKKTLAQEQISLVLSNNYLISFQESNFSIFGPVEERLNKSKGRIRRLGPDYLAYALLDAVVDNYFVALEKIGEEVEELQEELLTRPSPDTLRHLHRLRREGMAFRKAVWPMREVVSLMERGELGFFQQGTLIYLRDVYDHIIQVIDAVETLRDLLAGMLDIYLSSMSNRLNEIMKVLTIIATFFIPLTFITGIYGMNFKHMPELEWSWGYPAALGIMLAVVVGLLAYFRKNKWL